MLEVVEARTVIEKPGQLIRLRLEIEGEARVYSSRVEDLLPQDIVLSWPTDHLIRVPVTDGQEAQLEVRNVRGVFRLCSKISGVSLNEPPTLRLARSGIWSREQSRFDVRLDMVITPLETILLPDGLPDGIGEDEALARARRDVAAGTKIWVITVRNISAGGMMITSDVRLEVNDRLRTRLPLGKISPEVAALAEVRWASWDVLSGREKHKAGCEFLNLDEKERDAIRRLIFARQAELRRAGLL